MLAKSLKTTGFGGPGRRRVPLGVGCGWAVWLGVGAEDGVVAWFGILAAPLIASEICLVVTTIRRLQVS